MSSFEEKTDQATAAPFVFYAANNNRSGITFDGEDHSVFEAAIRVKIQGNDEFKTGDYKKAIQAYGEAVNLLGTLDAEKCGSELAICYQNRAAAYEKLRQIPLMIADATKAIEADNTYAKGYFRRARGYIIEKKFYAALQDAVWACIFDRYRTEEYRKMAAGLSSRFESLSAEENAERAQEEIKFNERQYYSRERYYLEHFIKSSILDDILIPIGDRSTATGYLRAMRGLNEFKLSEIQAGCTEEIASRGSYWIEGRILLAYTNSLGGEESQKDLDELFELLAGTKMSPRLQNNIRLCLANILMAVFETEIQFKGYDKAREVYQFACTVFERLERDYLDKAKIHLVKAGVLQQALAGCTDDVLVCSDDQCLVDLMKCCELMPNYYFPHMQFAMMNIHTYLTDPNPTKKIEEVDQLRERFPDEIDLLNASIAFTCIRQPRKAIHDLNEFRLRNPELFKDTLRAEGLIHMRRPESVECFKQSINYQPYYLVPYRQLSIYFEDLTHEYGKALEVFNKCLDHVVSSNEYGSTFEMRQNLLARIVAENYWDRL